MSRSDFVLQVMLVGGQLSLRNLHVCVFLHMQVIAQVRIHPWEWLFATNLHTFSPASTPMVLFPIHSDGDGLYVVVEFAGQTRQSSMKMWRENVVLDTSHTFGVVGTVKWVSRMNQSL
jgi:hypothetical protein